MRGGRGGAGANGVGVIPFCAPENRGLHKIVQPYLRGHVVLCLPISFPQKWNNTGRINNPLGNTVNTQILGILAKSVHYPAFHPPFWIYTRISGVLGAKVLVIQWFKAWNYKTWRISRTMTTSHRRMDIVNRNSSLYQLDKSAAFRSLNQEAKEDSSLV